MTMIHSRLGLLALLLLSLPAAAAPLQITGRILNPPKDAQVELRPWTVEHAEALRRLKGEATEAIPPIASAKPRLDGSFAVKVPDTGFYSVVASAPGRLAMETYVTFVVEEAEILPVELPPTSPLEVRAVGADGQPLAGATILALPLKQESGDWRAAGRSAVTDAEGKAVFHRAEGEALTLIVTNPGRYSTASTSPTGASETVRFPAHRSRMVEFRGANGKPAAGALVRLARRGWPYGLTGEDGRIPLPVPLKDEIGLFAEDSKGLRIEIVMTVEAGEGTDVHVVNLKIPTPAAGRVLEASSREPIAGALVWNGGMSWARTGSAGTFEIRAPSGDRGRVEASAAGRTRAFYRWQRDENPPVTLLLEPAAPISGQVVDEAGKPVEGAKIETVTNPAGSRMVRVENKGAMSGAAGRFVLRQLPAGRVHTVMAAKEGFAPARQLADSTAAVRLILRKGTVAVGRVVDEQGLPVAGVKLTLALSEEADPLPRLPLQFSGVSDAKGSFRLPNVSGGRFDLLAERPGFTATSMPGILIPENEAQADLGEVTLLPGAAIEGIVVDERDKPVEGAEVVLTPAGSEGVASDERFMLRYPVVTGADGRFRIADLPLGMRVGLKAWHPELTSAQMAGVEVPTAQPVRLRLTRPRSLEGRVKDRQGEPVARARLYFSESPGTPLGGGWDRRPAQATTDPEGRFVLSGLKPGTAYVTAIASGYRTRAAQAVQIPEEGQAPALEITLEPGTFLEGVVQDSRGNPIPEARVHIQGAAPHFFTNIVVADGQGHYEISDLEPGSFEVQASLHNGPSARVVREIRPGRNRLDFKLSDGTEISGRIVDSQGSPVPGAEISLRAVFREGETAMFRQDAQVVSSTDGSFVIQSVSDGEYRLSGTRPGFAPAAIPRIQVSGAPVSGLELQLGPGAAIRGRVLGLEPATASRVRVRAHSADGETFRMGVVDPSGSYRIEDVPPGEWNLVAHLGGNMVTAKAELHPGEQEVVQDLEFASGFTLTGRVLLDRNPLPGVHVVLIGDNPEMPGGGLRETAHDGTFRLERVPPGTYMLQVTIALSMAHAEKLEISGDRDLVIEIVTGAVEGRLISPEGLPVAGAAVSLVGEELGRPFMGQSVSSDDQGVFALPRVPAGTYKLAVRADGFAPAESRVVVTPGGTVHVDLILRP
jgi:protocatechuate 3,4-dioxygenase beta subunit